MLELTKWGLEPRNTFTLVSNTFYTVFKLESRLNPSLQVFQNLLLLKNVTKQTWFVLYPSFGRLYILGITGAAKIMNGKIEKWLSGKAEMKNFSIKSRLVLNCSIQNKVKVFELAFLIVHKKFSVFRKQCGNTEENSEPCQTYKMSNTFVS